MTLFLIHCGFYEDTSGGIYESHMNIPVAAANVEIAKRIVRENPVFQSKKMHIDGIQEITIVNGYNVILEQSESFMVSSITNHLHRDL